MKIKPFIKLIRPLNVTITFLSVWAGVFISAGKIESGNLLKILLASIGAALINASGNVINDVFDIATDKANRKKNRPLVDGEISKKAAVIFYVILTLLSIPFLYYCGTAQLIIGTISIVLLFLYSLFLKRLPMLGNIIVGLETGLVFVYAGFLTETWWNSFIPFYFAVHINIVRELIKSWEDLPGDSQNFIYTLPYFIEETTTKIVIAVLSVLLMFVTYLPYYFSKFNEYYLIIVMLGVNIPLIYVIKKIFEKEIDFPKIHKTMKAAMLFGLLAMVVGVM